MPCPELVLRIGEGVRIVMDIVLKGLFDQGARRHRATQLGIDGDRESTRDICAATRVDGEATRWLLGARGQIDSRSFGKLDMTFECGPATMARPKLASLVMVGIEAGTQLATVSFRHEHRSEPATFPVVENHDHPFFDAHWRRIWRQLWTFPLRC